MLSSLYPQYPPGRPEWKHADELSSEALNAATAILMFQKDENHDCQAIQEFCDYLHILIRDWRKNASQNALRGHMLFDILLEVLTKTYLEFQSQTDHTDFGQLIKECKVNAQRFIDERSEKGAKVNDVLAQANILINSTTEVISMILVFRHMKEEELWVVDSFLLNLCEASSPYSMPRRFH